MESSALERSCASNTPSMDRKRYVFRGDWEGNEGCLRYLAYDPCGNGTLRQAVERQLDKGNTFKEREQSEGPRLPLDCNANIDAENNEGMGRRMAALYHSDVV